MGFIKFILLAMVALFGWLSASAWAQPSEERRAQLIHRLRHDCGSCHGMTLKGGLGPPLLPAALAGQGEELLVDVILNGIEGTPMPPWGFEVSRAEAQWLVQRLMQGVRDDRND